MLVYKFMPGPKVILVVDDEEAVRLLVSTLIERASHTVLLANDGVHALEVSRKYGGEIHVLVTDYKMPRLNGLELAKILATERPGIHVMMMSGRLSNPEAVQESRIPVLRKPFTITGFMTSLKHCIEN